MGASVAALLVGFGSLPPVLAVAARLVHLPSGVPMDPPVGTPRSDRGVAADHVVFGPFWGAGKHVMIFLADPNISEASLPTQFQGNLWTRDARRILESIRAFAATVPESGGRR